MVKREAGKGKRKSKKNKKKRCKGNKCKKSQRRKGGKRKNKRKSRKEKSKSKGRRTKKISKSKPEERQSTDYSTCFPNIFRFTVRLKKARNIQNQFKRINSSRAIIAKKKGKQNDFSVTLDILVAALGGDKSVPKCSQSRAFNGALSLPRPSYVIYAYYLIVCRHAESAGQVWD